RGRLALVLMRRPSVERVNGTAIRRAKRTGRRGGVRTLMPLKSGNPHRWGRGARLFEPPFDSCETDFNAIKVGKSPPRRPRSPLPLDGREADFNAIKAGRWPARRDAGPRLRSGTSAG